MKLDWENCKGDFGEWADGIKPIFHLLEPVYEQLKFDTRRGLKVAPAPEDVFRAFRETPLSALKGVVLGIAPYHTVTKEKVIVADGLALSCGNTKEEQPSLTQWYNAMEKEYKGRKLKREPDLVYLSKQGILMFNMSLTVEVGKPLSHNDLWKPFIKAVFVDVISTTGVPVMMLGTESKPAKKWLSFQMGFEVTHPASASYNNIAWDSEGVFRKMETVIQGNGHKDFKWILETEEFLF